MSIAIDDDNRPLYLFPQSAIDKPEDPVEKLWLDANHFRVFRVELREELCRPFRAEFDVWASDELLRSTPCPAWIWKSFDLFLETGAETVPEGPLISRRLRGLVTRVVQRGSLEIQGTRGYSIKIVLEPDLALLRHKIRSRVHAGRLSSILLKILNELADDIPAPGTVFRLKDDPDIFQKTQYEESDQQFLMRLAEEYGLQWYCDWSLENPAWVFTDQVPDQESEKVAPVYRTAEQRGPQIPSGWFPADTDPQVPDMVHHFALEYGAHVKTFQSASLNPGSGKCEVTTGKTNLLEVGELKLSDAYPLSRGFLTCGDSPLMHEEDWIYPETTSLSETIDNESDLWKSIQERAMALESARETSKAVGGNLTGSLGRPYSGSLFSLETLDKSVQPRYLVTDCHLVVTHYPNASGATVSERDWVYTKKVRLSVHPSSCRFVCQKCTPIPRIYGVRTAKVMALNGQKGDEPAVGRFGSVLLRWDWLSDGEANPNRRLARVCQPWAGNQYGMFFWPRVGNEVVVAFEQGDPDRPVVVGSVYGFSNLPPESMFGVPYGWVSGIVSRPSEDVRSNSGMNNFIKIYDDNHCQMTFHSITSPFEVSSLNQFRVVKGGEVNILGTLF